MILGNQEIECRCRQEGVISPFLTENLGPASYDLTITGPFLEPSSKEIIVIGQDAGKFTENNDERVVLRPGFFVLAQTKEAVCLPKDLTARVEGRSSVGRLGLTVHITAGFIDPGFNGVITMEIANLGQNILIIESGAKLAQIVLETTRGCTQVYNGKYQNQDTTTGAKVL